MRSVLDLGQEGGLRHFLLGGSWHVLTRLEDAIKGQYPDAKVVGKYSPPFRVLSEYELLEQDRRIIDSGADVIWVGLGTPKQDFESRRLVETIGVSAIAVGAAFDFLSGVKSEAPIVIQRLYLEWLFRLLSEPRRLFKRYFWGNFKFIRLISTNKLAFQISNTFWPRGGTCDE
jgi:N-acetylglucosaminyldiphosphoundecaprenol N-acetyl-beta-D-mannosaminyltransferase